LAIVLTGINTVSAEIQLVPLIICSIAIPLLAFNAFVIEYKKRFESDVKYWPYDLMVATSMFLTLLGILTALALKSAWAVSAFIFGCALSLPIIIYLDKLVKSNKNI